MPKETLFYLPSAVYILSTKNGEKKIYYMLIYSIIGFEQDIIILLTFVCSRLYSSLLGY